MQIKSGNRNGATVWALFAVSILVGKMAYAYNWQTCLGQGGGSLITNLTVDPNDDRIVFISGDFTSGIWRSTNSGDRWSQVNKGLQSGYILDMAVPVGNSDIVFAATRMGPHKSTNGGETWAMKRTGLPPPVANTALKARSVPTNGIAVHPTNPNVVYICVGFGEQMGEKMLYGRGANNPADNGLWKSTDAGESWAKVSGFPAVGANTLTFDPQNPNTMWVGCGGDKNIDSVGPRAHGVYKSTDGGVTWETRNNGMTTINPVPNVWKVIVHPSNSDIVYVSTTTRTDKRDDPCIYWTTDGGSNWERRDNGIFRTHMITHMAKLLVMNYNQPNILVYTALNTGVYKSTDSGANWVQKTDDEQPYDNWASYHRRFKMDGKSEPGSIWWGANDMEYGRQRNVLYTQGLAGIHRSYDMGENWTTVTGIQRSPDPEDGFFRSTGMSNLYNNAIVFDPKDPNKVYAAFMDSERFMRSDDGGFHWRQSTKGSIIEGLALNNADIAVDPDDGRIIYWCESARERGSMYRSTNYGENWMDISQPSCSLYISIVLVPGGTTTTRTLYTLSKIGGVYKSTNSGASWVAKSNGLELNGMYNSCGRLAIDPNNSNILYCGSALNKFFKTTNGGDTWTDISGGVMQGLTKSLAINPRDPQNIVVGRRDPGVLWMTTDGGASWSKIKEIAGSHPAETYRAIAFDPHDATGNTFFCAEDKWQDYDNDATLDNPFMSTDKGKTWTSIADGLNQPLIFNLEVSPHEPILWAGTAGGGISRVSIPHLKGLDPNWKGPEPTATRPVSQPITRAKGAIRFDASSGMLWVPVTQKSTIEVFNGAGRRIRTVHSDGLQNIQMNLNSLASGMCVVRVSTASGSKQYRFAAIR